MEKTIQFQPISQLSRGKLFSPHLLFLSIKNVVQSQMPISIILLKLIQANSQQQLLQKISKTNQVLFSSVLVDPQDCLTYKIFHKISLKSMLLINQI